MSFAQDSSEFNCSDFSTQPEAQQFYEANDPEDDPYVLDADSDGVACESLNGGDEDGAVSPSEDEDSGLPEDQPASEEQYDSSVAGAQYQQEPTTPDTGGPALLPLAGAILLLGLSGYLFSKR